MELSQRTFEFIRIAEEADGVVVVTMNRPEKRNALSLQLMHELIDAFCGIGAQPAMRAVVLRAGHDLRELQCRDIAAYHEIFDVCVELMRSIQRIAQPVIAEVGCVATAAGCQLVATCDLALASPQARFATPGVRRPLPTGAW